MQDKIRLVLIDDHPMLREGVAATLSAESDMEVVGQGCNAGEALNLASEHAPDLILLDISMAGGGLNAAKQIVSDCPSIKVVMLTASEDEDDVLEALRAGARGYILKGVGGLELVRIVRSIQAGEAYVNPSLAANLLGELGGGSSKPQQVTDPLAELSERERETLKLVATGLSNKEVARELFLSEKTIKHYMTSILHKLHVRNRLEAAMLVRGLYR